MRSRYAVLLGVVSLLFGIFLATAGPAAAEELRRVDASGDVIAVNRLAWQGGALKSAVARPAVKDPDFRRVRIAHGERAVAIVLHLRRMLGPYAREDTVDRRWVGRIRTDEHVFRFEGYFLDVGKSMWLVRDGEGIRCRGDSVTLRYAERYIAFRWPRACLGNPTWVRVGVKLARNNYNGGLWFQDDPLAVGTPAKADDPPILSRRLYHG